MNDIPSFLIQMECFLISRTRFAFYRNCDLHRFYIIKGSLQNRLRLSKVTIFLSETLSQKSRVFKRIQMIAYNLKHRGHAISKWIVWNVERQRSMFIWENPSCAVLHWVNLSKTTIPYWLDPAFWKIPGSGSLLVFSAASCSVQTALRCMPVCRKRKEWFFSIKSQIFRQKTFSPIFELHILMHTCSWIQFNKGWWKM